MTGIYLTWQNVMPKGGWQVESVVLPGNRPGGAVVRRIDIAVDEVVPADRPRPERSGSPAGSALPGRGLLAKGKLKTSVGTEGQRD